MTAHSAASAESDSHCGRHAQGLLTPLEPCDVFGREALVMPIVFFYDLVDNLLFLLRQGDARCREPMHDHPEPGFHQLGLVA